MEQSIESKAVLVNKKIEEDFKQLNGQEIEFFLINSETTKEHYLL